MNHEPRAGSLRFPREQRLRRKTDIDRVFREGKRCHRRGALVIACRNGLEFPRMAVLVAKKKHHKSAVVRNRVRRLVREAYRHERHRLACGFDLAILPDRDPKLWTLADLRDALGAIFDRLRQAARL